MDIQTVIKAIPGVTEPQAEKLCRYYEMLMDWNSRMNLTAITGEDEVQTACCRWSLFQRGQTL